MPACTCPSGDGSLRWPCQTHPPETDMPDNQNSSELATLKELFRQYANNRQMTEADALAKAIAALTAPAMLNGVEGLMQLARNWCLAWGEWAHDADPGGANENAAEAALRAALTTALAKPPAEAFDPSIHPIPGEGQQPTAPSEAVNVIGMPEFDGLLDYIYEYGTEAEGVIERASAFARAVIARYAPQQPAMPNGVEEARVLVAQAPDRRPRPAAPRGLQVSRACQSYVERSGICADGFIQTRHCRGDFAGCPMCKAPTQTVPNCQLEDVERNPHFNEDGSPRYYKPQGGA